MAGGERLGAEVPAPPALRQVAAVVDARLVAVLDAERARWRITDPELGRPLDALARLVLQGGKRLRPAFFWWAAVGAGADPTDPDAVDAAAALELLQAFALIHDDVMDGSATRRGERTVHLDFVAEHLEQGWRGEPRRFGEGVAILLGDLGHVLADRLAGGLRGPAAELWHELRLELNVGQYLDLLATARGDHREEVARRVAIYKSGKYTVERPLHLGCTWGGRPELREGLSRYGLAVGEAFQLRDDLLGAFGEPAATGKPVGDDLREGKPTLLLAVAEQRATPAQVDVLARVGGPLGEGDVDDLRQVLEDTGARAAVEAEVQRLTEAALAALVDVPLDDPAPAALRELAWFVATRGS